MARRGVGEGERGAPGEWEPPLEARGVAHNRAPDDAEASALVRRYLGCLP